MARIVELILNGRKRVDAVPDNRLLLDYLRETRRPHRHQDRLRRRRVRRLHGAGRRPADASSCLTLAATRRWARGWTRSDRSARTARLSAVQRGLPREAGSQCGYCTPGFIMASAGLLRRNPRPSDDEILRGARQQHLPLHRLREDHRGRAARRRACWQRGRTVSAVRTAGPSARRIRLAAAVHSLRMLHDSP